MPPRLKTGREARAGLDRAPVTVPVGQQPIRTPANPPPVVGRSIAMPVLAVASLLVHAGVIGSLIFDFWSLQGKAKRALTNAIQVEVVRDPFASLFRHPTQPTGSEQALPSGAASDAPLVVPQSVEPLRAADRTEGRVAVAEPRATDDTPKSPLGAGAAVPARTGDADLVFATRALDRAFAADPGDPAARVEAVAPVGATRAAAPVLPAQLPLGSDAQAPSVGGDKARPVADAIPTAATRDKDITPLGGWYGAGLAPASAAPTMKVRDVATMTPLDRTDGGASAADPTVSMAPAAIRLDEDVAPEGLAVDKAATIVPTASLTEQTAETTGGAEIRMIMPSIEATVASEVNQSRAPTLVGATVASGILNAPWAPWGVQVAGDFSLDGALASFSAIEREYPEFRTGPPLIVRKLNRSRGWAPLYQILIPAADQRAANDICRRLESTDGACMVFKN